MKKSYKLRNLDCAHCAAKMEDKIKALPGVRDASVSFLFQRLTLEADDARFNELVDQAAALCRKVEPDCELVR